MRLQLLFQVYDSVVVNSLFVVAIIMCGRFVFGPCFLCSFSVFCSIRRIERCIFFLAFRGAWKRKTVDT